MLKKNDYAQLSPQMKSMAIDPAEYLRMTDRAELVGMTDARNAQ
jgi:hypothetical protein